MSNCPETLLEVGDDGVAIITINTPPLNLLSIHVMMSLKKTCDEALVRDDVKAIVIIGSGGNFSAGFQLTTFGDKQKTKSRTELGFFSVEFLTDTLEAARKPLVAAIEGFSFGGALELALACHARISTSTAQLGLTELQYGLLPGAGGTIFFPYLSVLIRMSKRVNGEEARKLGLIDAIATSNQLLKTAREWALDIYNCRKPWILSLYRTDRLETLSEARAILSHARVQIKKQSPNLKYLLICIDVIEEGIVFGPRKALWKEAEALEELRQSITCRSLIHIFFAQRQILKIPGITKKDLMNFSTNLGKSKTPILSGLVDRMFGQYFQAALLLVEHGVDLYQVDEALTSFGMKFGPFRFIDLIGFGVSLTKIAQYVAKYPERSYQSMLIQIMQQDHYEGEVNRKGFYLYDEKFMAMPNPMIMKYVVKARNPETKVGPEKELSNGEIAEMILFPVLNEASRIIAEGISLKASDLDVVSVMGMGFPAYRGGIIFWADSVGPKYICSRLEEWSKLYGDFFLPCAYLLEQASKGASFGLQIKQVKSQL